VGQKKGEKKKEGGDTSLTSILDLRMEAIAKICLHLKYFTRGPIAA